jgi:hypothetical protein
MLEAKRPNAAIKNPVSRENRPFGAPAIKMKGTPNTRRHFNPLIMTRACIILLPSPHLPQHPLPIAHQPSPTHPCHYRIYQSGLVPIIPLGDTNLMSSATPAVDDEAKSWGNTHNRGPHIHPNGRSIVAGDARGAPDMDFAWLLLFAFPGNASSRLRRLPSTYVFKIFHDFPTCASGLKRVTR